MKGELGMDVGYVFLGIWFSVLLIANVATNIIKGKSDEKCKRTVDKSIEAAQEANSHAQDVLDQCHNVIDAHREYLTILGKVVKIADKLEDKSND